MSEEAEATPLTLIQELRQVEGLLAMSRQYRPATVVKMAIDDLSKAAEHVKELEEKIEKLETALNGTGDVTLD